MNYNEMAVTKNRQKDNYGYGESKNQLIIGSYFQAIDFMY